LTTVFDQREAVTIRDFANNSDVGRAAKQVHNYDRDSSIRDQRFDRTWVHSISGIYVGENRNAAEGKDGRFQEASATPSLGGCHDGFLE